MNLKTEDLPPIAEKTVRKVLGENETKHPTSPWKEQSIGEHIHHAVVHLICFDYEMARSEDHLANALTRITMAIAVRGEGDK